MMRDKSLESRVESQTPFLALRWLFRSRRSTLDPRPPRSGMTLIELLVVIIIMTVIVAAAIPLLSPSNDDRRLREAARGLNTFITGAQSRAIAIHRLVGVALKRLSQDTNTDPSKKTIPTKDIHADNSVSLEAYYVEQPPAYCGFDSNSRACVAIHPSPPPSVPNACLIRLVTRGLRAASLPQGWAADLFPNDTIRPGDVIEVNGTRFELLANRKLTTVSVNGYTGYFFVDATQSTVPVIMARPINDSGQQINPKHDNNGNELGAKSPAPYWTSPAPYKILRQPAPMADEPYQLPEGTAIDLRASGVGSGDYFYVPNVNDNSDGVLIMFTPEGRVARVSYSQLPVNSASESAAFDQPVVDNVFLLIGRRENAPPPDAKKSDPTLQSGTDSMTDDDRAKLRGPLNWLQGSSRWVVIGSQSGRVATIENAAVDLADIFNKYTAAPYKLTAGSEELRNQQILTAREFTREMSQVGGR